MEIILYNELSVTMCIILALIKFTSGKNAQDNVHSLVATYHICYFVHKCFVHPLTQPAQPDRRQTVINTQEKNFCKKADISNPPAI